jgi:hypothetical protein
MGAAKKLQPVQELPARKMPKAEPKTVTVSELYAFDQRNYGGLCISSEIQSDTEDLTKAVESLEKKAPILKEEIATIREVIQRYEMVEESYSKERYEVHQPAFLDAWYCFLAADLAVVKAGGASVMKAKAMPGALPELQMKLEELEDNARVGEGKR